jgi:hypothetical protein
MDRCGEVGLVLDECIPPRLWRKPDTLVLRLCFDCSNESVHININGGERLHSVSLLPIRMFAGSLD